MATYTKRGDSWLVRIRKLGVSKSATFPTKGKAKEWAAKIESEIVAGVQQPAANNHTLKEALQKYAEEVSPTKRGERWEKIRLQKFQRLSFADQKLNTITTPILAAWRDEQLKTLKTSTINRELNLISSVFEQARREWQWIQTNPVRDVRRPPQPKHRERLFTQNEIDAITHHLGYPGNQTKQQIIAAAFLFALQTAMRREEITTLTWPQINLAQHYLTLNKTKNGDARDVPLSLAALQILTDHQHHPVPFPVDKNVLSTLFRRACIALKIENAHFHDARANAITDLSHQLDILELARAIGHRDVRSLQIYYRKTAADIAKKLK